MNLANVLISIISFCLGTIFGWFLKSFILKDIKDNDARIFVLVVVSIMWLASVATELVNPSYKTSPFVHGLMGSIVGFFYTFKPKK